MALTGVQIRLAGKTERRSEPARVQNRANCKIPDVPNFVVINGALLAIAVLALVALRCDSGHSDLPN